MIAAFLIAMAITADPKIKPEVLEHFDSIEECVTKAAALNQGMHYDFDEGALVKGVVLICVKPIFPT